jgi:6-oxo-cyclohex-1-ene-carbonyl-CoA hydrolase
MSLDWMPRDNHPKDHLVHSDAHFGTEAPCVVYEKRPLRDPAGNVVDGLFVAWVRLNNPKQYNSYTTEMVKGVIAGMENSSVDRSVVAVVFTATGFNAFCTGGNTKEYAEYYSRRPDEYGQYMELFNHMVDSILCCKKPVICRVNGMRVAGGQEIGMACDLTITSDLAVFGQAGPKHGSAPDGGSTDFLPWMLGIEDAMWNCVSCEMWSSYKAKRLRLISSAHPVIHHPDQGWIRNPTVITDEWLRDGDVVYGHFKSGADFKAGRALIKQAAAEGWLSMEKVDEAIDAIIWRFANLFPGCLIKSMDSIRAKKKFFWDHSKAYNRHWLAANMGGEAFLGFSAFSTRKLTGQDVIDFIGFRQHIADADLWDMEMFEDVLGKPR